jgi:hypothetical protein
MEWLFEFVPWVFGEIVGHKKPWWVGLIATLGCIVALLAVGASFLFLLWVLFR